MWKTRKKNGGRQGNQRRDSKKRKREEEKEENETTIVQRKCVNPVLSETFDIFSQEDVSESGRNSWSDLFGDSCGLSDCVSVALSGVPVVIDVPVSPSSAVAVMSEALTSDSDWEIVEPQSSFSRKRSIVWVENQETIL